MTSKKHPQNLKSTRNKTKSPQAQIYFFSHFQGKIKNTFMWNFSHYIESFDIKINYFSG